MSASISKAVLAWGLVAACGPAEPAPAREPLSREQLLDPAQCKGCHPQHYREWASSMHAYASRDPVFVAMNARGQRETDGAMGAFCVRCHAPMALLEGATLDGQNLAELPPSLQGVTCYFCHNAIDVGDHFNNDITLANDTSLRGGIADPVQPGAHHAEYSAYQDRNRAESSALCGSCHDVVTPAGVHLERTFLEYQQSLFAMPGPGFDTCSGCHMPGRIGLAASQAGLELPMRTVHEHLWPGVDVALSDFPDREAQRLAIECALASNARVYAIEHDQLGSFTVLVETSAGHSQPSGASQDRRLWIEFVAYDEADQILFESGRIADGEVEDKPEDHSAYDPNLAIYRDWLYDRDGQPTHDFWKAAPSAQVPDGYVNLTLPAALQAQTAHTLQAVYRIPQFLRIARITVRLRMRAIGIDVLEDLVRSNDLAADVVAQLPTFTLHGAAVEWRPDGSLRSLWPDDLTCPDAYLDLLR